ncbi:MAG: TIGR02281 family clan AA aspartic protease [Rickettsiales bacterium]|nr:TIGR02281 family clan AA aspartic protease [Rickettsiales bacterium]
MRYWVIILTLIVGVGLYLLNKQFPYILDNEENSIALAQISAVLILIVLGLARSNFDKKLVVNSLIVWTGIALIGLTVYGYQWELKQYFFKVFGQLVPAVGQTNRDGSVTFYAGNNGHFMIDAKVNGYPVHFLLDTGATKITLSARDAKNLGIDLESLKYDIRVQTAKGVNFVAYIEFDSVQVGDVLVKNIGGYVAKEGLSGSLLGMNFLNKLSKYEVGKGKLTLWQ